MMSKVARYNVGDLVRSEPSRAADYEYEVDFGADGILIADDNQLKSVTTQQCDKRGYSTGKKLLNAISKRTLATS
jgi:hypothetical protein